MLKLKLHMKTEGDGKYKNNLCFTRNKNAISEEEHYKHKYKQRRQNFDVMRMEK